MEYESPDWWLPEYQAFGAGDIVRYADQDVRSLDEALAEADFLVSAPHAGDKVPGELREFLDPRWTQRLQYDFTDRSTHPVGLRWAAIDRRVIYVANPHPRLVRDPNRPQPADLEAQLRLAFAMVREAGPGKPVDLKGAGVDAVRPVSFGYHPVLVEPCDDAGWRALAEGFTAAGARGLDVYQRVRQELLEAMVENKLRTARDTGIPQVFVTLGLHDTMNHTARSDGAVCQPRPAAERLPRIVALSNRGDSHGDARGAEPVTLDPVLLRMLGDAHRSAFGATATEDVVYNQPYLGGNETTSAGAWLDEVAAEARSSGTVLGAVQAEFRREFLMGDEAAAHIMSPGTDWPLLADDRIDRLAHACSAAWSAFRSGVAWHSFGS